MRAEYTPDVVITNGVWVDARAYGVTADGVTDETTEFQAFIDAIPANGMGLVPRGTTIVSNITGVSDMKLVGHNSGLSVIKHKAAATNNMLVCSGDIELSGVQIDGNKANQTGRYDAVNFSGGGTLHVHDCLFRNTVGAAIHNTNATLVNIHDNEFLDLAEHGGTTGQTAYGFVDETTTGPVKIKVCNNNFVNSAPSVDSLACTAIMINPARGTCESCIIMGNSVDGFGTASGSHYNHTAAIDVYNNADYIQVVGNTVNNPYWIGIRVIQSDNTIVSNNVINAPAWDHSSAAMSIITRRSTTTWGAASGIIVADNHVSNKYVTLGTELGSGNLTVGKFYIITAIDDADFTADGAAINVIGEYFEATNNTITLDSGDKVQEVTTAYCGPGINVSGGGLNTTYLTEGRRISISGNVINGATNGIYMGYLGQQVSLTGNVITDFDNAGILVTLSSGDITITGGSISVPVGSASYGIEAKTSVSDLKLNVSGVTINADNMSYGVFADTLTSLNVSGCLITGSPSTSAIFSTAITNQYVGNNNCESGYLSGTSAERPIANILAGAHESWEVTVPGVEVGDIVQAVCSINAAELIIFTNVTGANTVDVSIYNGTGSTQTLGTCTFSVYGTKV